MKHLIILFLLPFCILSAQELEATVTINTEKLSTNNRDLLVDFPETIEAYLNNNRYTNDSWNEPKIKCSFNIFFISGDNNNNYSAQVSITSLRAIDKSNSSSLMLNVMDNVWEFNYEKGRALYFNPNDFNSLTSFLDYYAYVIIGLDFDSYEKLSGSRFFSQAFNIATLGANSSNSKGWDKNSNIYNRRVLVEDLINEKFRQFRENYFDYHYNGLDLLTTDKEIAQKNMVKLIKDLENRVTKHDLRGVLLRVFFDAKSGEIINHLEDYPDKTIFTALKRIDPSHISKYDEAFRQ